MEKRKMRRHGAWKLGLAGAVLAAAVAASLAVQVEHRMQDEQLEGIYERVRRAAVSCYAIEGRYPQQLSYLEDNYGLTFDKTRYHVRYDAFASNIMPDIDVSIRGEEEP